MIYHKVCPKCGRQFAETKDRKYCEICKVELEPKTIKFEFELKGLAIAKKVSL